MPRVYFVRLQRGAKDADNDSGGKPIDRSAPRGPPTAPTKRAPSHRKPVGTLQGCWNTEALCCQLTSCNDMLDIIWKSSSGRVARRLLPEFDGIDNIEGLRLIEDVLRRWNDDEYLELAALVRLRQLCLETGLSEKRLLTSTGLGDHHRSAPQPSRSRRWRRPQSYTTSRAKRRGSSCRRTLPAQRCRGCMLQRVDAGRCQQGARGHG